VTFDAAALESTGPRSRIVAVLDVLISVTRFMSGDDPKLWGAYTGERKRRYGRFEAKKSGRRYAQAPIAVFGVRSNIQMAFILLRGCHVQNI
jgi:hypothetical protein